MVMELPQFSISYIYLRRFIDEFIILYFITSKPNKMEPDMILTSDTLDILFEHRNKEYGAYELRRSYRRRLVSALAVMIMMVSLFFLLNYYLNSAKNGLSSQLLPE